jgi:hypothetical protein
MQGIEPHEAGLLLRLLYRYVSRKVARLTGRPSVLEPVKLTARHPRLLLAVGQMEMGQEAARSLPVKLKQLASIHVARRIGCPF